MGEPDPPNRLTPPITAAAIDREFKSVARRGVDVAVLPANRSPAETRERPAQRERLVVRLDPCGSRGTPPASGFEPMA